MSRIDRYLTFAFEAIKEVSSSENGKTITLIKNDCIESTYKGYVSSLGANIIQAGLETAVFFYEAKESGSSGNKRLVTLCIHYILQKADGVNKPVIEDLSKILSAGKADLNSLATKVMDAATALKLAIRTYKAA